MIRENHLDQTEHISSLHFRTWV